MKFIIKNATEHDNESMVYAISIMRSYYFNSLNMDEVKTIKKGFGRKRTGVRVSRGDSTDVIVWKTPGAIVCEIEADLERREMWHKIRRKKVNKKRPKD